MVPNRRAVAEARQTEYPSSALAARPDISRTRQVPKKSYSRIPASRDARDTRFRYLSARLNSQLDCSGLTITIGKDNHEST